MSGTLDLEALRRFAAPIQQGVSAIGGNAAYPGVPGMTDPVSAVRAAMAAEAAPAAAGATRAASMFSPSAYVADAARLGRGAAAVAPYAAPIARWAVLPAAAMGVGQLGADVFRMGRDLVTGEQSSPVTQATRSGGALAGAGELFGRAIGAAGAAYGVGPGAQRIFGDTPPAQAAAPARAAAAPAAPAGPTPLQNFVNGTRGSLSIGQATQLLQGLGAPPRPPTAADMAGYAALDFLRNRSAAIEQAPAAQRQQMQQQLFQDLMGLSRSQSWMPLPAMTQ